MEINKMIEVICSTKNTKWIREKLIQETSYEKIYNYIDEYTHNDYLQLWNDKNITHGDMDFKDYAITNEEFLIKAKELYPLNLVCTILNKELLEKIESVSSIKWKTGKIPTESNIKLLSKYLVLYNYDTIEYKFLVQSDFFKDKKEISNEDFIKCCKRYFPKEEIKRNRFQDLVDKELWLTSDGRKIKISDMSTSHIENILSLFSRNKFKDKNRYIYIPLLKKELEKRNKIKEEENNWIELEIKDCFKECKSTCQNKDCIQDCLNCDFSVKERLDKTIFTMTGIQKELLTKEKKEMSNITKKEEFDNAEYKICCPGANKENTTIKTDSKERIIFIKLPKDTSCINEETKFSVPSRYDLTQLKASIKDGVMTINVPVSNDVVSNVTIE
jgi:HSP20 family molecular chaperone IbpA